MLVTSMKLQAGLKIIQLYMEGYRQDWGLSFEKDTRTRGGWYVTIFLSEEFFICDSHIDKLRF